MALQPRLSRTVLISVSLALLAAAGCWTWRTQAVDRWETRLIETALRRAESSLPFRIEKVEIHKTWRELFTGKISRLALVLRRDAHRLRLNGPLQITSSRQLLTVEYDAEAILESEGRGSAAPLELKARFLTNRTFTEASGMRVDIAPESVWKWKALGIEVEKLRGSAEWSAASSRADLHAESVSWTDPQNKENAFQARMPSIEASFGPELKIALTGESAEGLFGTRYFDVPWAKLPLHATFDSELSRAELELGPKASPARLHIKLDRSTSGAISGLDLSWDTPRLQIAPLLAGFTRAAPGAFSEAFGNLAFKEGTIQTEGRIRTKLPFRVENAEIEGKAELQDATFRVRGTKLAARRLDLTLPFSSRNGIGGSVSVEKLYVNRLGIELAPTDFQLRPDRSSPGTYRVQVGQYLELPLRIPGIPVKLSSIAGTFRWPGLQYSLSGSLRMDAVPIEEMLRPFCIPTHSVPPASVTAHFERIEFEPGIIDPTGKVRAELFGGYVEADELGLFDALSDVPELDFSVRFDGIRLDELGHWMNFGEMDGILTGYAKDVTFQSWLPTHYDARFEAKPRRKKFVIFSPEAMKSTLGLISPEITGQLPGFVQWYAFGWPRKFLGGFFGDYDIDYLGLELQSEDGFIHVRTLDRPELHATKDRGKHFILYSDQFKMPLDTERYPAVIDASSMANFIRRMFKQFGPKLQEKSHEENGETDSDCTVDL